MKDCPIINVNDALAGIPEILSYYSVARPGRGRKFPVDRQTGETFTRLNVVCALTLETSTEQYGPKDTDFQAWVHAWVFQVGDRCSILGRDLYELVALVTAINQYLDEVGSRILVYSPELSRVFPFLAGVWDFSPDDVFATDKRMPLLCKMGFIEIRCASRLANYKIAEWARVLHVDHAGQLAGTRSRYPRYPWSDLPGSTVAEYVTYAVVIVECVVRMMVDYGDTVYSIPYTATGYVRRRVRGAMHAWSMDGIGCMQNELYVYDRLQQAFRGGDTYAAMRYRGAILADVTSYDRSSSYPDVIVHQKFPMSRFKEIPTTWDAIAGEIQRGRAALIRVGFKKIRLKNPRADDPYISESKCRYADFTKPLHPVTIDEDRLIAADYIECVITDIDLEIIESQYTWEEDVIYWAMSARYGFLPQPLIDVVIQLYQKKTRLKGVAGHEVEYAHVKQELNSIFGMMAQRVIMQPVKYEKGNKDGDWVVKKWEDLPRPRMDEYQDAISRSMLNYAWGVWVTAWARLRLHQGIQIAIASGNFSFVYADTDSVKCRTPPDFTAFNAERIAAAKRSGAWAIDAQGRPHYMGVYEPDESYPLLKVLGRKCYAAQDGDRITVTVAGVPKERGSEEVSRTCKTLDDFDVDFVFRDCGKTGSIYNDNMNKDEEREGHILHITPNVALVNITHSMSLSPGYKALFDSLQEILDEIENPDYNHH